MRQYYWVLRAIVFAATEMPFFENCRTVASYIFAWTLPAEFSFQRLFKRVRSRSHHQKTICVVGLFTSHTNIEHQMSDQKPYAN